MVYENRFRDMLLEWVYFDDDEALDRISRPDVDDQKLWAEITDPLTMIRIIKACDDREYNFAFDLTKKLVEMAGLDISVSFANFSPLSGSYYFALLEHYGDKIACDRIRVEIPDISLLRDLFYKNHKRFIVVIKVRLGREIEAESAEEAVAIARGLGYEEFPDLYSEEIDPDAVEECE